MSYVCTDNAIYLVSGNLPTCGYLGSTLLSSSPVKECSVCSCEWLGDVDKLSISVDDEGNVLPYPGEFLSPDDYHYIFDNPLEVVTDLCCSGESIQVCEDSSSLHAQFYEEYSKLFDVVTTEKKVLYRRADLSKFYKRFYAFIEAECFERDDNDELVFYNRRLKFFSMSFPQGLSDDAALKIWNKFNVVVKQKYKRFDYIRVCERQKNGTIHFHFVTSQYIDCQYMCRRISRWLACEGFDYPNYNGLDLSKTNLNEEDFKSPGAAKLLVDYLAKYLTKSTKAEFVQPVSYSRGLSRLFTSVVVESYTKECYLLNDILQNYRQEGILSFVNDGYVSVYRFPHYRTFWRYTWMQRHLMYMNRIILRESISTLDKLVECLTVRGRLDIVSRLAIGRY